MNTQLKHERNCVRGGEYYANNNMEWTNYYPRFSQDQGKEKRREKSNTAIKKAKKERSWCEERCQVSNPYNI